MAEPRLIVLIGQRASGKTTVGRLLAREIGWDFADLDELVEKRLGMSCREIFEQRGEALFRKAEEEIFRSLLVKSRQVIAVGAGFLTHAPSAGMLRQDVLAVFLSVSKEELLRRRTSADDSMRPLLAGADTIQDEIARTFDERDVLYRRYARYVLDCAGRTPSQIVLNIKELMNGL